jgi:microcystin-dependent protein
MSGRERGGRGVVAGQGGRAWPKILAVLLLVAGIALSGGLLFGQSKDNALYIDPEGRVGVGTPAPQAALDVNGAVKARSFEGVGAVPKGAILMWSGAEKDIPPGWLLCDGKDNKTPDLRGRFVLAAGQGANLTNRPAGQPGGAEQHALTVPQMPGHNHGGVTGKDGVHQHRIHALSGDRAFGASMGKRGPGEGGYQQVAGEFQFKAEEWMITANDDTPAHQHTIHIEGGSQPFSLMPPYYALAFIMKVE